MLVFVCLSFFVLSVNAQMIPQCTCAAVEPCYRNGGDKITQCADKCQKHFTALGVSYPAARQCILAKMPAMANTVECARRNFGDVCAARPGPLVPKRYTETMQLAAFREINGILSRSGLSSQLGSIGKVAKKAVGCISKCMNKEGCGGAKNCGLALPSDNQVISTFKSCAINSGFLTTPAVQNLCGCLVNAGMRQIAPICQRIVIS